MKHLRIALLILLSVLSSPITTFSQASLPEPWNQVPNLSDEQKSKIGSIIARTEKNIEVNRRRIEAEQTEAHRRSNTPNLAKMDIAVRVRDTTRIEKLLERRDILALLSPKQVEAAVAATAKLVQTVEILNFKEFAAEQQNDYFCWAAAVQMLFNYNGIDWDQDQIADEILGSAEVKTATPQQISKGVFGWRLDHKTGGQTWRAFASYKKGLPPGPIVVGLLDLNRMVLMELEAKHIVVVHSATYQQLPDEPKVNTITWFDPLIGRDQTLAWDAAAKQITGWWEMYAMRSANSEF
jgi:hypothetical protein